MLPLEVMLTATQQLLLAGDTAEAEEAASGAAPYTGMTSAQIIAALKSGRTVASLLEDVDAAISRHQPER